MGLTASFIDMAILTPEMMTSLNDMTLGGVLVATGYLVALVSVRAVKHLGFAVGVSASAKAKADNAANWSNEQWAAYQAKYASSEAEMWRAQAEYEADPRNSMEWNERKEEGRRRAIEIAAERQNRN
jgi:hypothetical protein